MTDQKDSAAAQDKLEQPAPVQENAKFFRHSDWLAFWITLVISFSVYFYTLAPTVTLEDSGELAVASDYLGVPHPPGYPIWTLLTWLFQWVFHWVDYQGYPNPAWSVGLFSAVSGALACSMLALLVSRSGAQMISNISLNTEEVSESTLDFFAMLGGITAGLLYAFNHTLWSQSTIVEVYSLNALFLIGLMLLTYYWMNNPKNIKVFLLTGFIFGLGLTNHQTLVLIGLGLMAGICVTDKKLFRDCLACLFIAIAGYLFFKVSKFSGTDPAALRVRNLQILMGFIFAIAPVGLFFIEFKLMTEWKRTIGIGLLTILGLSFYLYMPFSSEQNPPMNWGNPRTAEGFEHALFRGQYERINPSNPFSVKYVKQTGAFFKELANQYTLPITLSVLALIPLFYTTNKRGRKWLITTLFSFFALSFVMVSLLNVTLDIQQQFISRVQFIQAYGIFAMWIGYSIIFVMLLVQTTLWGGQAGKFVGVILACLLPGLLVAKNYNNEKFVSLSGGAEQNGHDFGWQFGFYQLEGINGVMKDLKEGEEPPPNPDYPPPMTTNAVFFGGTDPGRFVPTYMIYSAKCREDVYLITQNALADGTYMNVMRDLYGDDIWIPSSADSNFAFQKYVKDVEEGKIDAGADVQVKDGRVSVQGVGGVMAINGILCKMIFEANKDRHDFYIEESYVISWMYPYLQPHGLIMKINEEKINLTPEMVKDDHDFWEWYVNRLMSNPKFKRDIVARKTFSKLRSAIAGIYSYRRMHDEAEFAFKQAIQLYPLSPEANFRLADLFRQQRKFAQAQEIMDAYLLADPENDKVKGYNEQVSKTADIDKRRVEIENRFKAGAVDIKQAFELVDIYKVLGMMAQFDKLAFDMVDNPNLPPDSILQVAQRFADLGHFRKLERALKKYLERQPNNARIWVDLAAVQIALGETEEYLTTLGKGIELGGEAVRDVARKDKRFDSVRKTVQFRKLVPDVQAQQSFSLPPGF